MSNPPLHLRMEPSPGSDIADCFEHALTIACKLDAVVVFDFNGVHCGVRPCDAEHAQAKHLFHRNYLHELTKKGGCKICYANP